MFEEQDTYYEGKKIGTDKGIEFVIKEIVTPLVHKLKDAQDSFKEERRIRESLTSDIHAIKTGSGTHNTG
jgi:hypothetical protein